MTGTYRMISRQGRSSGRALLLGLGCAAVLGCGSLLEVDNPNDVPASEIESPTANVSLANGVHALVAHGINGVNIIYATVTDEIEWRGSRDGFRELDQGKVSNAYNEFTDGFTRDYAPGNIAEARWMADEAIKIMEAQVAAGTITNRLALARVYLYAAMAYVTIANSFDDWVLSDRKNAGQPIGPANMGTLYDIAIDYLNKGLPIAVAAKDPEHTMAIQAMRARANFDRAIWERVNPARGGAGIVSMAASASYINAAVADAQLALAAMSASPISNPNYEYRFTFNVNTGQSATGSWIGSRQEVRLGPTYVQPHPTSPTWRDTTLLIDPIQNDTSSIVRFLQRRFKAEGVFKGYTMFSARQMHLILAEAALAGAATGSTFAAHINNLRALDNLTPFSGQVTDLVALQYSRQANLFLMTTRLSDHYRFNVASPEWSPGAQVLTNPGMFFPIPATECLSNPNIGAAKCST